MPRFVTAIIDYQGPRAVLLLSQRAKQGGIKAARHYEKALKRELMATQGSVAVSGGFKSVKHSAPGQPPFAQTFNLVNSVNVSESQSAASAAGKKFIFRISTRVPYAKALELGGNIHVRDKSRFRRWQRGPLLNRIPIHRTKPILARPAWLPTFNRELTRMITIIRTELNKAF